MLVCHWHGGRSPGAERKADIVVMLANMAAVEPAGREPWRVLLDALALADHAMVTNGDVESIRLAAGLASEAIKSKAHEQAASAMSASSMTSVSDLDSLSAVGAVIDRVLEAAFPQRPEMTVWAKGAAASVLVGEGFPPPPKPRRAITAGPRREPLDLSRVPTPTDGADGPGGDGVAGLVTDSENDENVVVPFRQPVTAAEQTAYLRSIGRNRDGPASAIYRPATSPNGASP